ncbi:MAG: transcriptional regulator, TetR family [Phenylobacterium sp.]|nr:transcriptional regulator, TetR family [Phenylobacterium sp.]
MGAKGMQTRRRLLDATAALLRTIPLHELSVAQIIKEARTSTSTFYVYFNDVAEAVLALTGEVSQSPPNLLGMLDRAWSHQGASDIAHEFVAAYLEQIEGHAALLRVRNLASDEGDDRFSRQRLNAVNALTGLMAQRISETRDADALPADLDPPAGAGALLALIERIAIQWPTAAHGPIRRRLVDFAAFWAVLLMSSAPVTRGQAQPPQPPSAAPARPPVSVAAKGAGRRRNLHGQAVGVKGERTRQRILAAVESLAHSRSLFHLKVADIVRAANTSNATFYLYFEDVPEAFLTVVETRSQSTPELLEMVAQPWRPECGDAQARRFAATYFEQWQPNRAIFRIRNLAADEGDQRFYEARAAAVRPLVERLTAQIAETQTCGRLPRELHPRSAAEGYMAMLERLAVTPHITERVTAAAILRAAALLLEVLMCGVPPNRA